MLDQCWCQGSNRNPEILVGLRTQTQNAAFFERKGPERKALAPREVLKSQQKIAMRFLNASVSECKSLNGNLSWGFPLGNLLPETRVLKHRVLERKRRPNANASVLGTRRFRTLSLKYCTCNLPISKRSAAIKGGIAEMVSRLTALGPLVTKRSELRLLCTLDFGRPPTKKVMSHSRHGPVVTAPLQTNIVPLTAMWNPPPFRYHPSEEAK